MACTVFNFGFPFLRLPTSFDFAFLSSNTIIYSLRPDVIIILSEAVLVLFARSIVPSA